MDDAGRGRYTEIMPLARKLLLIQGAYYALTGLWPLFSVRTFQRVTGPKSDLWLVKTAGLLIAAIAAIAVPLLAAGAQGRVSPEIVLLSAGSAAAAEAAVLISWAFAIAA